MLGPWVVQSVSLPRCSSQFIGTHIWDCPVLQPLPCHESSPPQLPISTPSTGLDECFFLTPWLLDFHTVQLSGSSGYFLFLNLLLAFFWLCKEVKCIYLHLHLGRKSKCGYSKFSHLVKFHEICTPIWQVRVMVTCNGVIAQIPGSGEKQSLKQALLLLVSWLHVSASAFNGISGVFYLLWRSLCCQVTINMHIQLFM